MRPDPISYDSGTNLFTDWHVTHRPNERINSARLHEIIGKGFTTIYSCMPIRNGLLGR